MKRLTIVFLIALLIPPSVHASTAWKSIPVDINYGRINCIAADPACPDALYLGTDNGLFIRERDHRGWRRLFTGWGGKREVNDVCVSARGIFAATEGGLFFSGDGGRNWRRFPGKASKYSVHSVSAPERENSAIVITTDKGVFRYNNNGWERLPCSWPENVTAAGEDAIPDRAGPEARCVTISHKRKERIYVGTQNGIFFSDNAGDTFRRFDDEGLLDNDIISLKELPYGVDQLFAVTRSGLFHYKGSWEPFEGPGHLRDVRSIAYDLDPRNSLWLATDRHVYKTVSVETDVEKIAIEALNALDYFQYEPPVEAVQEAAIRYAEVHPAKIADWRRRAGISALLPRLNIGLDKAEADTYEIYTSSKHQYAVEGPRKSSDGWDITVTWDLGKLIWNDDQTQIDTRSKLMVQLRDDILDEVTSCYFERRRLQIELLETVSAADAHSRLRKELRIQELTANLDALTGRYFSRALKERPLDM